MKSVINNIEINITENFRRLSSMPDDPEGSEVFGFETDTANCMMFIIPSRDAMPFDDIQGIIDDIHNVLSEEQGIIEVKSGKTVKGNRYVYSIVKTLLEPSGVQYSLALDYITDRGVVALQGFFTETGLTGMRDTTVLNIMLNEGSVNPENLDGWVCDPYDIEYDRGILMNKSEDTKYDKEFPSHPLSMRREFIKFFAVMN